MNEVAKVVDGGIVYSGPSCVILTVERYNELIKAVTGLQALRQFMESNLRMCKALECFVNRCPMCRAGVECQDDDCFQARQAITKWTAAKLESRA